MPAVHPCSSDASNKFEDLSGVDTASFSNPYDALIEACQDDTVNIQYRYSIHRTARNNKQRADLLSSEFKGLILDTILQRLEDPTIEPGFVDSRNSVVLWARPPTQIRALINEIQQSLKKLSPDLWLMPIPHLHMTALEITHSVTASESSSIIQKISPIIHNLTDYPFTHRSRLIKPLLSYDGAAVALSYLPAAGEALPAAPSDFFAQEDTTSARQLSDDKYTYHHLRRDIFSLCTSVSVTIESRYVVPSAHLTIARFVSQNDHNTAAKMSLWIEKIEDINAWLVKEFWPRVEGIEVGIRDGGEWIVGQEEGLVLRTGTLWYGGGETVRSGIGF